MSFTLRQVTQRAGGGEIVRSRTLVAAEISIGRGADCDLQLPDLAVSLRHASMRQTGPTQVTVAAEAGQVFEVGGRFTARASLDAARQPRLTFGSHLLTLATGGGSGEIVITVERLETFEPKTGDDEVRTFSPGAVGLSKRATAWTLGGLIVVLCLALPIGAFFSQQNARIHADRQWTSGPLSKSHAFLETKCQTCHQAAFVAVGDDACEACHKSSHAAQSLRASRAWGGPDQPPLRLVANHTDYVRLMRATPLPADLGGKVEAVFRRVFNHPDTRCASCHREHMDAEGQKPAAQGIPASGLPRTPLRDKPALVMAQDCVQCHGGMKARLRDTDLPDTPDWARHPEFRPLVTIAFMARDPVVRRIPLARHPSQNQGLTFTHDIHLSATGGVARMAQVLGAANGYGGALSCASCHRPDASGEGFKPIEMNRDCGACHSLAFARIGGQLQLLKHGDPRQVVAQLTAFYGAGGIRGWSSPPSGWSRRQPGLPESDRADVWSAGPAIAWPSAIAAGVRQAFSPGGACFDCHKVLTPIQAGSLAYDVAPVRLTNRYMPRGGFNHAIEAHRKDAAGRETCGDCHKARTSDRANDLLLPRIDQCATCHGKTHDQTPRAAGADCAECHSYHNADQPTRRAAASGEAAPRSSVIPPA
jgi:hypothetical protein